ncbi:MAG: 1-acyl-sn-glycerol-3-phosphate acyltransferase, partial [Burkholderiaceae bacterium]|nr:1-acyl-sn-glycerol-3-phosphate acyltransferase [Burkholderiaceae bacterium]
MRSLVALWRLLRLVLHVVYGVMTVWLRFPRLTAAQREDRIAQWSRRMLAILGIAMESRGEVHPAPKLVVANHVSWLDIGTIHAVMPHARFVSKADVRNWPVVSMLVEGARTLYIERASKRDALRVVHQTAAALQAGDSVAFFPEGTTGPGP